MIFYLYLVWFLLGVSGFILSLLAINNLKDEYKDKKYEIYFKGIFTGTKFFNKKGKIYMKILYGIMFLGFLIMIFYAISFH